MAGVTTRPGRLGVGVVGAGRVGTVLANALRSTGHAVVGVSATSQNSRDRADALLPGVPVLEIPEVVERSELVLLTVPDDALGELVGGLASLGAFQPGQLLVHTAGRYGVDILAPARASGAIPLAIHPAMTFTGTSVDLGRLVGAPFAVTADPPVLPIAQALVVEIGGEPVVLAESARGLYHAALAHGANHLVTLISQAIRVLAAAGIDDGGALLTPLLTAALDGALRGGETNLTGPIVRGDAGTVAEHLAALRAAAADHPDLADLPPSYHTLARATVQRALATLRIHEPQAAALLDALAVPGPGSTPAAQVSQPVQAGGPVDPAQVSGAPDATSTPEQPPSSTSAGATAEPGRPAVVHTISELRQVRATWHGSTAVVMTMGALHAGHLALVQHAREVAEHVIVTIFVNPLQFGAGEDLSRYPRTLDADLRDLTGEGVDLVFAPAPAEMYPDGEPQVWVRAGTMGEVLEGAARPGHFDGMLTVVNKLLHLTAADVSVFGQKDAQQLALVRRMVADQNLPTRIDAVPIVREADGLALSSRNVYLDDAEREAALVLSRTVAAGAEAAAEGLPADRVRAAARAVMAEADPSLRVQPGRNNDASDGVVPGPEDVNLVTCDYLELVEEGTMEPVAAQRSTGSALLVTAARVGSTRLLDNAIVRWPAQSRPMGENR